MDNNSNNSCCSGSNSSNNSNNSNSNNSNNNCNAHAHDVGNTNISNGDVSAGSSRNEQVARDDQSARVEQVTRDDQSARAEQLARDAAREYNKRWAYLYYLSGLGMQIYNTMRHGMGTEIYTKYLLYLLKRDGYKAEVDATLKLYWGAEPIGDVCNVGLLVNGNIIVDVYQQESIQFQERDFLKNRMRITHTPYGVIMNFAPSLLYSEWYWRDSHTGEIDKIKML